MKKVIFGLIISPVWFFLVGLTAIPVLAAALSNTSFEDSTTAGKATGWFDFGFGYQRVNTAHTGQWGIKLQNTAPNQLAGAYQRTDLNQTEQKPVFIGGYVQGSNIKNSPNGYFGASLYTEIHLKDGSVAYWNSIANYGTFSWRWIGFNTGTLSSINQPIAYIFVVPILGNATGTAYFDDLTVSEFTPANSAVTIMLDDGEDTAYTVAKPILDKYNFKASTAIITSAVGDTGYMTRNQIKKLQTAGWEIVSHSVNHEDLTTMTATAYSRELSRSRQQLTNWGFTVYNFALPYGAYNAAILAEGAKYYSSLRAFEQGENVQGAFPYDIKVRAMIDTTTVDQLKGWLDSAKNNHRWEVLVFHSITATGDDAYYTDPAVFANMMVAIAQSGLPIVTYNQGLQTFSTQE